MNKSNVIGVVGTGKIFAMATIMAMADKHPLVAVVAEKNEEAEIRISGIIHNWQNSSAEFKRNIDALIAKGIKNVRLYINTPGGSVFEANEIANEIQRFEGTIAGYGGALVASAGSYLAVKCDTFEMAENGQFMYHKPIGYIQGNEDKVASDHKLLQNLTSQYRTEYSNKTGLSEEVIEANWSKGDVWLSANEALKQGFITSISKKKEKITEEQRALFEACGAPVIPIAENSKTHNMNRNAIIASLKLPADATDAQIEAAIAEAKQKADTVDANTAATEQQRKAAAESMVQGFIDNKQTTADLKDNWVKMAVADFEGTKAILEKLPKAAKLSDELEDKSPKVENRENWTMEDYQSKDPDALRKMMVEKPEQFAKLEAAYFGQ
jgi:ATP-dependent Clp protease protease subunit